MIDAGPAPTFALAYDVQAMLHGGRAICGYKVGMVSAAKRRQFGLSDPVHGIVHPEMLLSGTVRLGSFIQPRVEPELAVVLRDDIPAQASTGDVSLALNGVYLAVDILDTVWTDYQMTPEHAVADGVNGGGFLVGDRLLPLDASGDLELFIDGDLITSGPARDLGDPVARCRWLAGAVGGLVAGSIIFLGSPAANVPARPGVLEVHGPCGAYLSARLEATDD